MSRRRRSFLSYTVVKKKCNPTRDPLTNLLRSNIRPRASHIYHLQSPPPRAAISLQTYVPTYLRPATPSSPPGSSLLCCTLQHPLLPSSLAWTSDHLHLSFSFGSEDDQKLSPFEGENKTPPKQPTIIAPNYATIFRLEATHFYDLYPFIFTILVFVIQIPDITILFNVSSFFLHDFIIGIIF